VEARHDSSEHRGNDAVNEDREDRGENEHSR
jgi:hypothetical protein